MIPKLPYLDAWDVIPAKITLTDGLTEDGEPKIIGCWEGKVNYSERAKRVQDKDGLWVQLAGVIRVKGDILPDVIFTQGTARIESYDKDFLINSYSRPRNPDGSVHHTRLELL